MVAALGEAQVLGLWEQGRARHPIDRAVLMLGAALPDVPYDKLADLPIGARDGTLLELRRVLFGDELQAFVSCPHCTARLEFELDGSRLALPAATTTRFQVHERWFRLPTSRDLARAIADDDPDLVCRRLAELCCERGDGDPSVDWTDELLREVDAEMAAADPQADLQVALACDACGKTSSISFDIVRFLWEEIAARASRLLQDVHLLARAYSWCESDVFALTPARRATYVAMANA